METHVFTGKHDSIYISSEKNKKQIHILLYMNPDDLVQSVGKGGKFRFMVWSRDAFVLLVQLKVTDSPRNNGGNNCSDFAGSYLVLAVGTTAPIHNWLLLELKPTSSGLSVYISGR